LLFSWFLLNCYEIAKILLITIELGVKHDCNDWLPMANLGNVMLLLLKGNDNG